VRDCCRLFAERLRRALDEEDPQLANWEPDATAISARYDLQDPATVGREFDVAAVSVADAFAGVSMGQRGRSARRR
jgi:hypothetical protein